MEIRMTFKAYRINKTDEGIIADFTQMEVNELTEGDVVIKVQYSGINYKDALAATGTAPILRTYPLNGGVDLAGVVAQSSHPDYKEGDAVLVNGQGLSETVDGGFAQFARVNGKDIVQIPKGMDAYSVMAVGTAGFTTALAYERMEKMGQTPDMGPILVTGATGGVGSFAVDLFASKGFEVAAVTGKTDQHDYLKSLGASEFLSREQSQPEKAPLAKALWGGAVDSVGGDTLTWLTQTTRPWGNIASIGLASSFKLNTTVMPFILRGVSLLGINSIEMSQSWRQQIWDRIGSDLKFSHLDKIAQKTVDFDQLPNEFDAFINSQVTGRVVVKIA